MAFKAKGRDVKKVRNYYEMKLRENRELIDDLKIEITVLSNMLWKIKQEVETLKKEYGE